MQVLLKSQMLAGGRGVGRFTNSLGRLTNGIHTCCIPPSPFLPMTLQVVLKSQILAGRHGLGRFTNGL